MSGPAPARRAPRRASALLTGLALALGPPAVLAAAQDGEAPPHAYALTADLDVEAHTVEGTGLIRWTNEAETPATELWLHLYLNAFASDETVFMRESGGQLRGVPFEGEGRIEVTELRLAGGSDLLVGADPEVIEGDGTQMRVPLPAPVPPGGAVELETRFRSTLPPVFARSGHHGGFHMVAQWFPKVAVRAPDGTWETFPYHGHGEFYADFARYELTVTTPLDVVVGATGEMVEETRDGERITRRFVADRVHDTAFCAWAEFEERTFEVGGVRVRLLHPPGYEAAAERHAAMVRAGLARFGDLFGPYPYPGLTVVVPPRGAEGAAGMEYPTLFLTAGPWFALEGLHLGAAEDVTVHELGHQWFQGMVASHEVRWPMLDEGLTQWATGDLLRVTSGARGSGLSLGGTRIDFFQLMRVLALGSGPRPPPPGRPAYAFSGLDLGRSVYGHTAIALETVGRVWGRAKLEEALSTYAREQRFRHPEPRDLYDAFDRSYWPGFSRTVLRPALEEGELAELHLASLRSRKQGAEWVTDVDARRVGSLPLPTWVELVDEAGERRRIRWPAGEERLLATHRGSRRMVTARVDPDRHNLLDPSLSDNVRRLSPAEAGGGIFGRLLFLSQQLLGWVGP